MPSSRPSISLNCLRISTTISPAALPTEVIVIAATTNGSPPPINRPITTIGSVRLRETPPTAVLYAANNARAVRAAEPIANPLPTAAVVLPMESSSSVIARTSSPSPLISAIPPALSATGPYASTVIVTPTVASIPIAAIAIQYNPKSSPPNSLAPRMPRAIKRIGIKVDIIPTDNPAIALVAGPVLDISPMCGIALVLIPNTGSIPV